MEQEDPTEIAAQAQERELLVAAFGDDVSDQEVLDDVEDD
jgi:hypothetical protein